LNSSLSNLLFKAATGHLEGVSDPVFDKDVAITVVLASEGYPDSNAPSRPIYGISEAEKNGVEVCHASTAPAVDETSADGVFTATGGRVLSVVSTGKDFAAARAQAYAGIEKIQLQGSHYRKDIAKKVVE